MKIFYCAKCNKTEIDFSISDREERIRKTWINPRDGFGRHITHLICPNCGYILSGFMIWHYEVDNSTVEYVKETIRMYSAREYE